VRLLAEHDGEHIGQIAFAASLGVLGLGEPAVEASPGHIVVRGSTPQGRPSATLTIPLTESGDLLLSWPRAAAGGDGFRHLAWSTVVAAHQLEDSLVTDLRDLDSRGYLSYLRSSDSLLDVYEAGARLARGMLAAGTDTDADTWRATRERFFNLCDQFLSGDAEARIVEDANRQLQSGALSDDEKAAVRAERDRVPGAFDEARQVMARLQAARAALRGSLAGSWCIVTLAPSEGSRPSAVTPFGAPASGAEASAALLATLAGGRFLRELPARGVLFVAALLALALAAATLRLKPLLSLLVGIAEAVAAAVVIGLVFTLYGLFVPPALPLYGVLASAVALALLKLGWKRAAARTVRAAFSGRVSTETMRDITAGRGPLALEGALRKTTVLCLRQAGGPASPAESPTEIVRRLRTHREAIAEAVLGLGGMLLESGPGVTAVFGAPLAVEDHARRACLASLRVRAMEQELNEPASRRFSSRIGIHTGESVTGLLGPGGLAAYELAGPVSEAASRLQALNDSLSTSVLVSEEVREAAGPGLLVRVLGSFPVVRPPLRVLELLAERDSPSGPPAEIIAEFEEGVARFERGEVAAAFTKFTQVLARVPSDGPSAAYARRCRLLLDHPGLTASQVPWGP
ncbi:MAG TPA: adenylate/guanylate cyclase domain-containing protein, partial [Spirochaetia bacterium]|nr:adenylate/guanylate cyclase domain-containing protein [Spirochaetia bacterium]